MAILYSLIAAVAFTVTNIYFRLAAKTEKDLPALSAAYGLLAGVFCIILILFEGGVSFDGHRDSLFIIPAIIGWAFFGYMIIWLSNKMEASINSLLSQTFPVFSFIIGILFFSGSASWMKVLGVTLIVGGNALLFVGKTKIEMNKVFWMRLIVSLFLAFTYLFDNLASPHFSFGLYTLLVYVLPSLLIMVVAKVRLKNLLSLFKRSFFNVFMISLSSFVGYYFLIKAYEFDNISLVIPITSAQTILTVVAGGLILGEKGMLLKKIVLGILVFAGVVVMGLS